MIQQKIGGFNKQKGKLERVWRVYIQYIAETNEL